MKKRPGMGSSLTGQSTGGVGNSFAVPTGAATVFLRIFSIPAFGLKNSLELEIHRETRIRRNPCLCWQVNRIGANKLYKPVEKRPIHVFFLDAEEKGTRQFHTGNYAGRNRPKISRTD